ncbi:MAG: glycosyltransferase, partial [Acidimicrobiia bacterium]
MASQQRRGAELFARDLVSQLSLVGVDQRVVALRGPIAIPAVPGTPVTVLDRGRVRVPFLRMGIAPILHLRKLVGEWEPDLIQAHGGEALKNATLAAFGRSTPVVYRRIGETPPWARRGPRRRVYSSMFRRAAMVIAVANSVREEMISLFHVAPTKVEVVPNAVDWSRVQPTKSRVEARDFMNLPQSGPLISSVGALIWEKDPLTHLEIVARVKQNHPDLVYVIAGDGPLREEMESYVRERDLVRSVIFLGSIASVSDLLSASDLLLFASRSEGMPASVIEAGMAGIPVVAFAVGG